MCICVWCMMDGRSRKSYWILRKWILNVYIKDPYFMFDLKSFLFLLFIHFSANTEHFYYIFQNWILRILMEHDCRVRKGECFILFNIKDDWKFCRAGSVFNDLKMFKSSMWEHAFCLLMHYELSVAYALCIQCGRWFPCRSKNSVSIFGGRPLFSTAHSHFQ